MGSLESKHELHAPQSSFNRIAIHAGEQMEKVEDADIRGR